MVGYTKHRGYRCRYVLIFSFLFANAGCLVAAPDADVDSFWDDSEPSSELRLNHSPWQYFLDEYLESAHPSGINRVKYNAVTKEDKAKLNEYLAYIGQFDPRQLAKDEQKAMWLNLYNALAVSLVLDDPSVSSIRQVRRVSSPWKSPLIEITMQEISLDTIEHKILRPIWNDPRVLFGLNCASLGSGSLPAKVYTGDNVDNLLEQVTREFLGSPAGVTFNGNRAVVSSLFRWYRDDFVGGVTGIKRFIAKHSTPEMAARINKTRRLSYQYEWALNRP